MTARTYAFLNCQLASRLSISEHTIATHIGKILCKLGLGSRLQLTVWVVEPADLPILEGPAIFSAVAHGCRPFACIRSRIVKSDYILGLPANGQLTGASYDIPVRSVIELSWRVSVGPIIVHSVTKNVRLVDAVGSLPDVGFARYVNG